MNSENLGTEIYSVNYIINNAEYTVTDTHEVHSRLQSDANFMSQYLENGTTAPVLTSIVDDATNSASTDSEIRNFSWTQQSTKLLLNSYLDRKDRFRDPKVKKKTLWAEILQIMKTNGYTNLKDLLDRKMRNMKKSYKNIKDNNNKKSSTDRGRVSWQYFETCEDIFADDMTINYNTTISSMRKDDKITETESSQGDNEVMNLTYFSDSSNICNNLNSSTASSISPFQPIDPVSPGCSSSISPVSPHSSVTPTSQKSEKAARMSTLHKVRQRQIDIEEKRIKTILEVKVSIDKSNKMQAKSNKIQKDRNNLLRELLLLRNNQHEKENT